MSKQQLCTKLLVIDKEYPYIDPVVLLDDYFEENTVNGSIAPNQWEYGLPEINELYKRLKDIRSKSEVQGMWVVLHPEWCEELRDNNEDYFSDAESWPAAECVIFYAKTEIENIELWAEGLECEVMERYLINMYEHSGEVSYKNEIKNFKELIKEGYFHPAYPPCPEGYTLFALVWD